MSDHINFEELRAPFPADRILWRIQSCGKRANGDIWAKCLAYIDARNVMSRLDKVVGPQNWKSQYERLDGSFLCGLSIKINGEWVTKWDGAEETNIEALKGGISDAFKRAAVSWGIGRYLYNLKESWAQISDHGEFKGKTKDNTWFKWDAPKLPEWALPKSTNKNDEKTTRSGSDNQYDHKIPKQTKTYPQKPKNVDKSVDKFDPNEIIIYGKYKGKNIIQAAKDEQFIKYCDWLIRGADQKGEDPTKFVQWKDFAQGQVHRDEIPF